MFLQFTSFTSSQIRITPKKIPTSINMYEGFMSAMKGSL